MKIAGATLNQTPIDWKGNVQNILDALKAAKEENVALLCFPELTISGYGCEDLFLSEWLWEKSFNYLLTDILPATLGISCAIGLPIKYEGKMYNCAAFIKDGKLDYIIPKQHMAIDGVHYEFRWFTPWPVSKQVKFKWNGESFLMGDHVIDFHPYKIGFEICEDAWRKERPAYRLIERGVNLILNPSASHFAIAKSVIRQDLVINSSKQFNCTYVFANLLGNEAGRMVYDGEIIIAKEGKLKVKNDLLSFKHFNLCVYDDEHDSSVSNYQTDANEEFRKAVSLALFDYLRKSYSNGFILSLSGGADSSTCAVLVAEMIKIGVNELGVDKFLQKINQTKFRNEIQSTEQIVQQIANKLFVTAYQRTKNSSRETFESARQLAEEIGAVFYDWSIDDEVASYTEKIAQSIGRELNWKTDDITLQNIQARARSPIIWMLANINNALLLTTSNRSEGDVGYTTMDGDTSGSIAPIAAIDKPFIVQWLKWAEQALGYESLSYVNGLQPSAELRPQENTQTDETDLMPYPLLLAIEKLAIRDRMSPVEVYFSLQQEGKAYGVALKPAIIKFFKLWSRNQWKRERIAPSFHLDDFNVDPKTWCRFPILSSGFKEELSELEKIN